MKVLFLDIDGVLNSQQSAWYYHRKGFDDGVTDAACPIAASNLHRILDELPDLKICVSSSWRIGESLESMKHVLYDYAQIPPERIVGLTPVSREFNRERGHEIADWLAEHPEVTRFVIVDDDGDMADLKEHLVQTNNLHGLLIKDANEILTRLTAPWQSVSGFVLNTFKEKYAINLQVVRSRGEGLDQVLTTYWGLKASCPNASASDAEMDDWAQAKRVEDKKNTWFSLRFFIKSTEAL